MTSGKFFALFLLCIGAPLALAKLSLDQGWFSQVNTNNKGQWLSHEVRAIFPVSSMVSDTTLALVKEWHLVYVSTEKCSHQCEQALVTLQQLYTGLGRKQQKLQTLVAAPVAPPGLDHYPVVEWMPLAPALAAFDQQILLFNQEGLALLQYPLSRDVAHKDIAGIHDMALTARDIRSDLLRLMNYDRGGL